MEREFEDCVWWRVLAFCWRAVLRYFYTMRSVFFSMLLSAVSLSALAQVNAQVLTYPDGEAPLTVRQKPMPSLDAASKLGKILTRYYSEGLGGPDHWNQIESLRVSGTIEVGDQVMEISAYQKKPSYIKMALRTELGNEVFLGYDGKDAWRQDGEFLPAKPMAAHEARRFIHSAHFGNHLLYPYAKGKRIEYVDTVPVDSAICHQIRVSLPTGYVVDYFIDIRSYLEVKVVNEDTETGLVSEVVYEDYIREFGMPIAKRVRNYEAGELVSSLELTEVKVNTGIMPFMFHMPK